MKKIILIATLTLYSQIVFGQIKVPNVGDGWKPKVEPWLIEHAKKQIKLYSNK